MTNFFAQKPQPAPAPTAPAPMPDSDGAAVREAARKKQMDILSRAGRSSTILTPPKANGGDTYASKTLGSGA